ncbi:hypothetical protein E2C01_076028 [Portunus trituberculatus]|uniref:Uncharacterized protein n=1 Tax=Portunus trituberculatus TaxID=210409 RepID=A0A5B7IGF7_PORTR|nr:hypothetical protein [Portunus trituberculatus]
MGLENEELCEFVLGQQELQKDERLNGGRSCVRRKEKRKKERILYLEQLKLQISLQRNEASSVPSPSVNCAAPRPSLPEYQVDDLTSYFTRFECIAYLLNLPQHTLAIQLGSLLSGKLADIYTTLPEDVINDYRRLKSGLLRSFDRTTEHYRYMFRASRIKPGETFEQFAS